MKYLQLRRISASLLSLLMTGFWTAPSAEAATYTVRPGDTFSKIARRHGVSLNKLLKANPSDNPDLIVPGVTIHVPGGEKENEAPPSRRKKERSAPETSSARTVLVSSPGGRTAAAAAGTYQVKKGDTLYRLASRFGGTPEQLMKLNGLTRPEDLRAGQTLKVPGESRKSSHHSKSSRASAAPRSSPSSARHQDAVDLTPPEPRRAARRASDSGKPVIAKPSSVKKRPAPVEREPEHSPFPEESPARETAALRRPVSPVREAASGPAVSGIRDGGLDREPAPAPVDAEDVTDPLSIGLESAGETPAPPRVAVRVRPGVSLEEIAGEFNTTPEKLKELNNLSDFDQIGARPMLYVPWPSAAAH